MSVSYRKYFKYFSNMGKNEYISMKNLEKICKAINLTPSEILEFVED